MGGEGDANGGDTNGDDANGANYHVPFLIGTLSYL